MATARPQLPKLTVLKATYAKSSGNDVTEKVNALLKANGGNFILDSRADFNQLFGDPEPGADKLFHMVFQYGPNGAQKSITHAEKHPDIYLPALEIRPGQVLTVNVVKALNLRNVRTLGKQDPYAKLTCGSESFKTKVHNDGGSSAEWNQSFVFNLDGKDQFMHVLVLDKGTLSDETIARFDIPLPTLAAAEGEVAYNLVHPNDFKKSGGSIVFKCDFKDPNAPVYTAPAAVTPTATTSPTSPATPQVVYQQPQPQVVYQQPQVVYQQPQMVQQPQVVYQQPQVVYQQPVMQQPQMKVQEVTNSMAQLNMGSISAGSQDGWRWCKKCMALWFAGLGNGVCASGGGHDSTGSGSYGVHTASNGGQSDWRWCKNCQVLHYHLATNRCPATGSQHSTEGSGSYWMALSQHSSSQDGWRWCNKCGTMCYGKMGGVCATGGGHDHGGSGEYHALLK